MLGVCFFVVLLSEKGYSPRKFLKFLLVCLLGLLCGARLFGWLSGLYRDIGLNCPLSWESVNHTGIVFYGGLLGLLLAGGSCLRCSHQDAHILDLVAAAIPLFHAVARVGCFLGGCCFGVEWDGPGAVLYTTLIEGRADTTLRLPVQLIETAFDFLLFLLLLLQVLRSDWRERHILWIYLAVYSVGRFFLEFLRGDVIRGVVCGVSFSQLISVLIWIFLCLRLLRHYYSGKFRREQI